MCSSFSLPVWIQSVNRTCPHCGGDTYQICTAPSSTVLHYDPELGPTEVGAPEPGYLRAVQLAQRVDLTLHLLELLGVFVELQHLDRDGLARAPVCSLVDLAIGAAAYPLLAPVQCLRILGHHSASKRVGWSAARGDCGSRDTP